MSWPMEGWLRQLALAAQVRAGWSGAVAIWAAIAALASGLAALFLVITAFVWLSHRYGATAASLALGIFFLVAALTAGVACAVVRRRNIRRAERELEERRRENANLLNTNMLDPKLLAIGYQIGDAIGWRRLASLAAVGLLAAGVAREWRARSEGKPAGGKPGAAG
jgi:hypothetical protein